MKKSLKSIASDYGLYLGAFLVLLTVLIYAIDIGLFVNTLFGISLYLVYIIFGIIAIVKAKQLLNGYISFKESFSVYFLTFLIGLLISSFVSYILFNFIDVEASEILKEKSIEKVVLLLEGFNTPVDAIAKAVDKIESENLFSIGNVLQSLLFNYLLPLTIIGLIVAAVMKKNNPDAA